jgi:membrane protein implicated in regulation of membrane protease activity
MSASVFSDLFGDDILNLIYAGSLFVGVMYSLFLLFFHGIGDALGDLDFDLDMDVDTDLGDISLMDADGAAEATGVSMLAIASFVSSFGAFGLISVTMFNTGAVVSLFFALLGGFMIGIAAQVFFLYILSPTISSEVRQTKLIGMVAEITTPIPANGVGQIAFVAEGSRMTYSARATEHNQDVTRGTPVRIERIVGGVAYVSKLD